jgi:phosphatidylserine decarboxylase
MLTDLHISGWSFRKFQDRYILGFALLFLLSVLMSVVLSHWLSWVFCVLAGVLLIVVLYFFRDPSRILDRKSELYYSPADGKVVDITLVSIKEIPGSEFLRIGIFMSVLDVHVQRSPCDGVVEFVSHYPGQNLPAYDPAASVENDQISMGIKAGGNLIMVKQIAGILARKCVNYAQPGVPIQSGQRYGLIKFGSRVELFLPSNVSVLVSVGERVTAGMSAVAEMPDA